MISDLRNLSDLDTRSAAKPMSETTRTDKSAAPPSAAMPTGGAPIQSTYTDTLLVKPFVGAKARVVTLS